MLSKPRRSGAPHAESWATMIRRMPRREVAGSAAEPREPVRAVAEHDDVGGAEQRVEARPVRSGRARSSTRRSLAVTRVEVLPRDLGHAGGSIRSTSAPKSARVRVATGPAITRVRSSTRTPASGAPGRTREPTRGSSPRALDAHEGLEAERRVDVGTLVEDRGADAAAGRDRAGRLGRRLSRGARARMPRPPPPRPRAARARSRSAARVVRIVAVRAHPPVRRAEEARQGGEGGGRLPSSRAVPLARVCQGDAVGVERDRGRAGDLRRREGGRGDRRPRQLADGEARREGDGMPRARRSAAGGLDSPNARKDLAALDPCPLSCSVAPCPRSSGIRLAAPCFRGSRVATRPGCGRDLPNPRIPRKLLLVRPTGKRKGREPHPPQAENHPPSEPLESHLELGWRFPPSRPRWRLGTGMDRGRFDRQGEWDKQEVAQRARIRRRAATGLTDGLLESRTAEHGNREVALRVRLRGLSVGASDP